MAAMIRDRDADILHTELTGESALRGGVGDLEGTGSLIYRLPTCQPCESSVRSCVAMAIVEKKYELVGVIDSRLKAHPHSRSAPSLQGPRAAELALRRLL